VEINVRAAVDNSWFYVAGELVDDTTGTSYPFERSIEYYHGYEGGESWSEGSTHERLWFSDVPGGKYYLNMDTESDGFPPPQGEREFTITVLRDVPYWWSFWWCALAVSILPVWFWLKKRTTEVARWSNSDYSPYVSSSD